MRVTAATTWRPGALLRDEYVHDTKGGSQITDVLGFVFTTGRCGTPTIEAEPGSPLNDRPRCLACSRRR